MRTSSSKLFSDSTARSGETGRRDPVNRPGRDLDGIALSCVSHCAACKLQPFVLGFQLFYTLAYRRQGIRRRFDRPGRRRHGIPASGRPERADAEVFSVGRTFLFDRLRSMLENGGLKLPPRDAEAKQAFVQLTELEEIVTNSGARIYAAQRGRHDDLAISLALLVWAARHPHMREWMRMARPRTSRERPKSRVSADALGVFESSRGCATLTPLSA